MPQNATGLWNLLAPSFNFDATTAPEVTLDTTFGQAYNGTKFVAEFNGILVAIDKLLRPNAAAPPALGDNDLMVGSLLNYPNNPPPPSP
jgi:hypothetical protein